MAKEIEEKIYAALGVGARPRPRRSTATTDVPAPIASEPKVAAVAAA